MTNMHKLPQILCGLLMCIASNAYALTEICGDGLMEDAATCQTANGGTACTTTNYPTGYMPAIYGEGADLKCPAPDQDDDGYTSTGVGGTFDGIDCDEANKFIYPGISIGCDAGTGENSGWKTCQATGAYTSCVSNTTPLDEHTGLGTSYYIDNVNGLDTNPGTYTQPWKTHQMFVYWYVSANKPAGHHTPVPGDVYYFLNGTYDDTFDNDVWSVQGQGSLLVFRGQDGTATNPITIKNYPGHKPVFSGNGVSHCLDFSDLDYWHVQGLTFDECWGGGFVLNSGTHIEVDSMIASNTTATNDNGNPAGFSLAGDYTNAHSLISVDNYARVSESNEQNNHNYAIWRGTGQSLQHSTSYFSTSLANDDRTHVRWKHASKHYTPTANNKLKHLTIVGYAPGGMLVGQRNVEIAYNRFVATAAMTGISLRDNGGDTYNINLDIHNNTFVGVNSPFSNSLVSHWPGSEGRRSPNWLPANIDFYDNVIVRDSTDTIERGFIISNSYNSDTSQDPRYSDIVGGYDKIDSNCYYNVGSSSVWSFAGKNDTGYETYGFIANTLQEWQSATGHDSNSSVENPILDEYQRATSTNCKNKGWLLTPTEAAKKLATQYNKKGNKNGYR